MRKAGAGAGTDRLAGVMAAAGIADPIWAAEQFMGAVRSPTMLSVPQPRGLGLGLPLDAVAQGGVVRAT
jgi:hypothetical protein